MQTFEIIKYNEITAEEAKSLPNAAYNAYEWKRIIDRYNGYKGIKFLLTDKVEYGNKILYAAYEVEGVRYIKEVSYISSLNLQPLYLHKVIADTKAIIRYKYIRVAKGDVTGINNFMQDETAYLG